MHLKRLELVGFKSFAQKTVFDFPAGIAAVVGPNGSGKSNIIDAIRWLLGEREAKNMRSLKAEDLIFAGTPHKPRLGLAQATIVFDNHSRFFPVDYEEIAVRRRLTRDGTGTHFLNDSELRLKDIIDFFAQCRLGTKGFSIINQGDSDLFVRVLPRERRLMLEEILGLRQYELKKHDAELKLKNTRFNMEKAQALIDELLPHLRLLRRQTAKWVKHADLEKELRELENQYFVFKLQEIESDGERLQPELTKFDAQIAELTAELRSREQSLRAIEVGEPKPGKELAGWQKEKEKLFRERSEMLKEIGRLEAQIEMALREPAAKFDGSELVRLLEEARETLEDALMETDVKTVKKLLKIIYEKISHMLDFGTLEGAPRRLADAELDSEKEKLLEQLKAIDKKLDDLTDLEHRVTDNLKNFNAVFKKAYEAVEAKKDELTGLDNQKHKMIFERERLEMRREELAHEAIQLGRKLEEFQLKEAPMPMKEDRGPDWIVGIEKRMLRLRGELAGIGEIDQALIREAEEAETRYKFLSTQVADLERAYKDLKALIKELGEKIHHDFSQALKDINEEFHKYFRMMFGGGSAKLTLEKRAARDESPEDQGAAGQMNSEKLGELAEDDPLEYSGIDINLSIPRKRVSGLDMLSGGEKSLVSLAVLFALISVSPPPFLVLDEVDAALDESNSKRFANLIRDFSKKTQFLLVTHNRATMEAADILYGVTMGDDGTSRVLSLKLE